MRVLDLFSGIGGFSLGLERAGMETVAFCEIDKHCQKVLKKHWPDIPIYDDVTKLRGKDFTGIDVLCGGFPCQDISVAGQKKGMKHDGKRTRSGLWEEFARLIKEIKPRYAIIENVANLRNLGLNQVVKDLWSIGYVCEWHIISARSVGACHLRERVWIIAYPDSNREKWEKSQHRKRGGLELHGDKGINTTPNSDMPRLWKPFASEEEKSEWWAKTTAGFRDWWEVESEFCRMDARVSFWVDVSRGGLDAAEAERVSESLRNMPSELYEKEIQREIGGLDKISFTQDLWSVLWKYKEESNAQDNLPLEGETTTGWLLRELRHIRKTGSASYRQELQEQYGSKYSNFVQKLSHEIPLEAWAYLTQTNKNRAERIKQLGNSVVPQIPELIGRAIMEWEGLT